MIHIRQIADTLQLLTAKETEEGNMGVERYRRAFKTLSGTYLAQIATILTALITTPLILHYLGNERYGLMISLVSVFFFFGYLDLGCGIGIQNGISEAYGKSDHKTATAYSSSGFAFYTSLASLLAVLSLIILPYLPLQQIFKIETNEAISELLPTVLVVSVIMSVGLISTYVQRLCDSLQQGYLTRFALVFSRIISFIFIVIGVYVKVGLPVLVCIYIIPSIASLFAYGLVLKKYPWMKPQVHTISFSVFKRIISTGVQGLGAIIAYSLMLSTVPLVISNRIGAASVIHYSVVNQLVVMMATTINNISTPFWPAIAEAMSRGDKLWVRRASKRFFSISIVLSLFASLFILLLGRTIIYLWTHNKSAVPSLVILLSMSSYLVLLVVNANLCTVLNGLNRFRGQAIYGAIIAIVTVFIAYLEGARFGVAGIAWVYTVGFFVRCVCLFTELHLIKRTGVFS